MVLFLFNRKKKDIENAFSKSPFKYKCKSDVVSKIEFLVEALKDFHNKTIHTEKVCKTLKIELYSLMETKDKEIAFLCTDFQTYLRNTNLLFKEIKKEKEFYQQKVLEQKEVLEELDKEIKQLKEKNVFLIKKTEVFDSKDESDYIKSLENEELNNLSFKNKEKISILYKEIELEKRNLKKALKNLEEEENKKNEGGYSEVKKKRNFIMKLVSLF